MSATPVGQTLLAGLTYAGDGWHTALNAGVLLVTLVAVWLSRGLQRRAGLSCCAVVSVLQVLAWFYAHAVGVSLVWSALAGVVAAQVLQDGLGQRPALRWARVIALYAAGLAIVFYACAFPWVSTVAHLLALFVGLAWAGVSGRRTRGGLQQACVNHAGED